MKFIRSIKHLACDKIGAMFTLLALALAMVLGNLGGSIFFISKQNIEQIDHNYTSIAIEDKTTRAVPVIDLTTSTSDQIEGIDSSMSGPKSKEMDQQVLSSLINLPYVKQYVQREACIAVNSNLTTLASSTFDPLDYQFERDQPYNIACLVVRCLDVKPNSGMSSMIMNGDGTVEYNNNRYTVYVQVINAPLLHPSYKAPQYMNISSISTDKDNKIPFEKGKTYFVWGCYTDVPVIVNSFDDGKGGFVEKRVKAPDRIPYLNLDYAIITGSDAIVQDEKIDYKEDMPVYIEYGSKDYDIKTAAVIKLLEKNLHQIPVIALDSLNTMMLFQQKKANVIEGRQFSREEVLSGKKVCIINASFAKMNHLSVGDIIDLSLYDTDYVEYGRIWRPNYLLNNESESERADYTIIGIYSMPLWYDSDYSFSPNTFFVPVSSVTGDYFQDMPVLKTLVLQNGSEKKFEEDAARLGIKDRFVYLDQGYSNIAPLLLKALSDAQWLFIASGVIWLALIWMIVSIYIRRQKSDIRIMRLLGTSRLEVFRYLLGSVSMLLFTASIIGCIASLFVTNRAVELLFSINNVGQGLFSAQSVRGSVLAHPENTLIILCGGVVLWFISLAAASIVIGKSLSKKVLMQKVR